MTVTTCDGCNAKMDHTRMAALGSVPFKIHGYEFHADLSSTPINWSFNTTNVHICRECMLAGLLDGLSNVVRDLSKPRKEGV